MTGLTYCSVDSVLVFSYLHVLTDTCSLSFYDTSCSNRSKVSFHYGCDLYFSNDVMLDDLYSSFGHLIFPEKRLLVILSILKSDSGNFPFRSPSQHLVCFSFCDSFLSSPQIHDLWNVLSFPESFSFS